MEVDWEKRTTFSLLRKSSKSHLFYNFQGHSKLFPAPHSRRWAGREKVALFSFGYQNIFATSLSFDSGKISELQNGLVK